KQSVLLEGDLNLHNVSNNVSINWYFVKKNNSFKATSKFEILTEDYDIKIPKVVRNKIAKKIEITLNFDLQEFNKK
nr:hypothetical protein [Prolixibacteraceae bacterium]